MVFHLWSLEAQAQGVKPQKLAEWVLKLHKRAASKEVSDYCSRGGSKRIQGMPYEVLEALVLKAQASLDEAKKR